jgi:hypothetical protein
MHANRAAPNTPASSAPSCVPARTPAPLPAGYAPPQELPAVPLHTVPLCTCPWCPTETHFLNGPEPRSLPLGELPFSVKSECGDGLLLLRHVTPQMRRDMVYSCSGAPNCHRSTGYCRIWSRRRKRRRRKRRYTVRRWYLWVVCRLSDALNGQKE